MHPTTIKAENGYLGKYERILNPGDTQVMNFESTIHGPFWMTNAKREQIRKDKVIEGSMKMKNIAKTDLIKRL